MRKKFKAILKDNQGFGEKLELLIKKDYAEILTEEDKAYMKGNFENFTENDFANLIDPLISNFPGELEAFDVILKNFCRNNEVDELRVTCENWDTSIFSENYAREKLDFAKTVEVTVLPNSKSEEKLTKINGIFFLENEIASAIIEKGKIAMMKPRIKDDFFIVNEFEDFVEEVRKLEKLL